jgi:hypothetical protein
LILKLCATGAFTGDILFAFLSAKKSGSIFMLGYVGIFLLKGWLLNATLFGDFLKEHWRFFLIEMFY